MSAITKVSEITTEAVADYLHLSELDEAETDLLNTLIGVAKSYIVNYTGQTEAALDNFPDFVIVVYILVQDMWDNRVLYVEKSNLNNTVESILGLHSVNLLPTTETSSEASND